MKRPPSRLTPPALRLIVHAYLRRLGEEHRAPRVRVTFNRRLRTAIGRCDPPRGKIYLNPRLIDRYPKELVPTLVHELCHVVAGIAAGHGPRWKELMQRCGLPPLTYHDLEVAAAPAARTARLAPGGRAASPSSGRPARRAGSAPGRRASSRSSPGRSRRTR